MGTINAKLLSVEANTIRVNRIFSWGTSKRAIQPSPSPWSLVSAIPAVWGEFPASREVLILTQPEKVGAHEVKR
jgi:hypothetical protein